MVKPNTVSRKAVDEFEGAKWNAINDLLALSDLRDLTPLQRIAYLAYWYMSEVENGGHFQYFINRSDFDHDEVAKALESIGAAEHSANLRNAHNAAHGMATGSPDTSEEYVERDEAADLSAYDAVYSDCGKSVYKSILAYTTTHEEEFLNWAP
jgi:hypothetical protein